MIRPKRKLIIIVSAVLIIVVAAAVSSYILLKEDKKVITQDQAIGQSRSPEAARHEEEHQTGGTTDKNSSNTACTLLNVEDAKKLLNNASLDNAETTPNKTAENVTISNCAYTDGRGRIASLLVRTAQNEQGSANDKEQFGPNKPADAPDVQGYGDAAYWNPDYAQLNILKGNTWYVATYGSAQPNSRTLQETKVMVDLLKSKL